MKKFCNVSTYLILLGLIIQFYSCDKIPRPQPDITTSDVTLITKTSAGCGGNITSDFGATVDIRGICWSTSTPPTIKDRKAISGSGLGSYICYMYDLTPGTVYYVRAYYTNNTGTEYGNVRTFTTLPENLPTVTTSDISSITKNSATGGGNVLSDGSSAVTKRGICFSTGPNPTIYGQITSNGTGTGSFVSNLNGLGTHTKYYVRAYATNQNGTSYGNQVTFTTNAGDLPVLTTVPVTLITPYSAKSGGNITSDGGSSIPIKGVCWSTSPNPTIYDTKTTDGPGNSSFSSILACLTPNTTYYIRAYANNDAGTAYGNELSFTTSQVVSGQVYDIDGNLYHTVIIGTQEWMVENLKVTHYRNGTPVTYKSSFDDWCSITKGVYCDYLNMPDTSLVYGKLYNWYVVSDTNNIAPVGWHVPSDSEWTVLSDYLGGLTLAGGKLKETGFSHWKSPNSFATNETGFTALPGGSKACNGSTYSLHEFGFWWSTHVNLSGSAGYCRMWSNYGNLDKYHSSKTFGYSIRCVKDK